MVTPLAVAENNLNLVPADTVLMSTRAPIGHMAITTRPLTFNQGCRALIPNLETWGPYLLYLLKSRVPELNASANGTTFVELSRDELASVRVTLPPLETQKRIATFLDEKTAKIDALIARKHALLERLTEKRQAIITQAVTKGLNPAAPMKDSGINWLGQIPAHWDVKPLKRMAAIWGRIGFRGYTVNDIVSEGEGALSLSPSNIIGDRINYDVKTYISWDKYHESPEIKVRSNDILFVKTGSTIGKVCHVADRPEPMTVNPQVVVLKVHSAHSLFLSAAMSSTYFQHQVKGCIFGGSTPAMTQYNLGSLSMVVPPLDEQLSISNSLVKSDNEHSTAKRDVERSIALLSEYRSALITSAVTGQILGLQ
jgi:type I restriction enzyme S subunit